MNMIADFLFVQTAASPVFGVRVSCGHLCKAEAPTEAAAETVGRESASEGLLQTYFNQKIKIFIKKPPPSANPMAAVL